MSYKFHIVVTDGFRFVTSSASLSLVQTFCHRSDEHCLRSFVNVAYLGKLRRT